MGIKKPVIQPKNKEKIVKEEIKKKPSHLAENENRFKSKFKARVKSEILKSIQQDDDQNLKHRTLKIK
ncbi:hypothetical protein ACYU02_003807 [Enterobacter hormaechei]|uniref:hypothetical protein n=1 Tax=Enterobacter hormaechei TaxID=158836 RepID=UPI000B28B16C|nr:hypothetical protein [Enterobacter hormaechei]